MLIKSRHFGANYSLFAEDYISKQNACQGGSQKVNEAEKIAVTSFTKL